ncbi:MAG TPA: DinB family protein [Candidatus Thermoplasmatota archaeon]
MDAIHFFLLRYGDLHGPLIDDLLAGLSEAQWRQRPHPGVNPIVWLLWHMARVEDVAVNRFLADRPQVLDEERWLERLTVARRDVGTGMDDAEVNDLSARIDLPALRGYWDAVTRRTLAVVETLRGGDLDRPVSAERVRQVAFAEGAVGDKAAWLADFWAAGRTRAWVLLQVPLLHVYGHYYEARVAKGLWGIRSP